MLTKAISRTREMGRAYMLMLHPNIIQDAVDNRIDQIKGKPKE